LCREEASELSSAKAKFGDVPLYGVVHQKRGVADFQPFFKGEIFLDVERRFYGPKERWMSMPMGFLRLGVWKNIWRVSRASIPGNLEGEGRLLGGVFVLGPGKSGILYEHLESEWGDHANMTKIVEAVQSIAKMK